MSGDADRDESESRSDRGGVCPDVERDEVTTREPIALSIAPEPSDPTLAPWIDNDPGQVGSAACAVCGEEHDPPDYGTGDGCSYR